MKKTVSVPALFVFLLFCAGCQRSPTYEVRDDFKKFYDDYHVSGSFVLFDLQKNHYLLFNREQFHEPFIPASTFKICNSLIGLETGTIKDADFVIPWDSVSRQATAWNRDHTLRSAFRNSVVPYYQELARRIGGEKMKQWLDNVGYGNADTSGGIDRFWLDGGLRITPAQQIDFLKRLYQETLPFSKRSMDIVKDLMVVKDTLGSTLRAKTGGSDQDGKLLGWYVGYIERKGKVHFFSNCIQGDTVPIVDFLNARAAITSRILTALGLLGE